MVVLVERDRVDQWGSRKQMYPRDMRVWPLAFLLASFESVGCIGTHQQARGLPTEYSSSFLSSYSTHKKKQKLLALQLELATIAKPIE